jgi:TPR repeat protein
MKCLRLLLALLFLSAFSFSEEPAIQIARIKKLSVSELEALRERAQHGNADAQLLLGLAYDGANKSIKQDAAQARHWYEMSAKQGNLAARFWLVGMDYQQGQEPSLVLSRYLELAQQATSEQ